MAVLALFTTSVALASEEGFIYQGKTYVVYKDGAKVGKTYAELFPEGAKDSPKRLPAGGFSNVTSNMMSFAISYQEHEDVRCYYHQGTTDGGMSCVRFR